MVSVLTVDGVGIFGCETCLQAYGLLLPMLDRAPKAATAKASANARLDSDP